MRTNVASVFPTDIDPLLFFQDCDIDHKDILPQYYQLINNGHFSDASSLMENSDVDFYGAWLLNTIENRLRATEEFIDQYRRGKPLLTIYNVNQPSNDVPHWVGFECCVDYEMFKMSESVSQGDTSVTFTDSRLENTCLLLNFFDGEKLKVTSLTSDTTNQTYTINFEEAQENAEIDVVVFRYHYFNNRKPMTPDKMGEMIATVGDHEVGCVVLPYDSETNNLLFASDNIESNALFLPVFLGSDAHVKATQGTSVNQNRYYLYGPDTEGSAGFIYINPDKVSSAPSFDTTLNFTILERDVLANTASVTFTDSHITNDALYSMFSDIKKVHPDSYTVNESNHTLTVQFTNLKKDIHLSVLIIN